MKALALLSGGLDSILAIKVVQRQGIEVEAFHVVIPFLQNPQKHLEELKETAKRLSVKLHLHHCDASFFEMIQNPCFGYGKNFNPCVDCRIYQLKAAKEQMLASGAQFLITGEVLDQRPHSQRRDALDISARESGLRGLILRPLCAQHLQPTIPEERDWVDRGQLLQLKGRGRTEQLKLASDYEIDYYPAPAGGCLLTYKEYSQKLRDLIEFQGVCNAREVELLKIGRHLRLNSRVKIIVGKDQTENERLKKMASSGDTILESIDFPGPVTLYQGEPEPNLIELAAAITAGYAKVSPDQKIRVEIVHGTETYELNVDPLSRDAIRSYFVCSV